MKIYIYKLIIPLLLINKVKIKLNFYSFHFKQYFHPLVIDKYQDALILYAVVMILMNHIDDHKN